MLLHIEFVPGTPLRRQLERQLRDAIRNGRLRPGTSLPPSRVLASDIGVSRGVVVDCYSQLVAEGYLSAKRGAGTRVRHQRTVNGHPGEPKAESDDAVRHDLRPGQPDYGSFPRRRWHAALSRALRELPDRALHYPDSRGIESLRSIVAEYVGRVRAAVAEPDQIIVSSGLAHTMSELWLALRRAGATRVAIEDPGCAWQRYTVEHAGLTAVPVRVDRDGLVVAELERLGADAVAVTPGHHFPTGATMSSVRRAELTSWARRTEAVIVEDDYGGEYRYDGQSTACLQSLAPEHVVFCPTTRKALAPALRLTWTVVPHRLVGELTSQRTATQTGPSVIEQTAAAAFISTGEFDRHVRRMRLDYRAKRDVLLAGLKTRLPALEVKASEAGLHVLLELPADIGEHQFLEAARHRGLAVHAMHEHCTVVAPRAPALLLGYGHLSKPGITRAVSALSATIEDVRTPAETRQQRMTGRRDNGKPPTILE